MVKSEDMRRVKRVLITEEFIRYLFENPENLYIDKGLPGGATMKNIYEEPARGIWSVEYQHDEWEPVQEGELIPELEVEFREVYCDRCENEMLLDEDKKEQYCPRCERRFSCVY